MAEAPGIELAKAYVTVIPSMRGARQTVAKELGAAAPEAERQGKKLGDRLQSGFGKATSRLGDVIGKTLKRGMLAGGAAVTAAGFIGVKTASELETARISFETMLGSAEKAERFLSRLSAFAQKTPFDLPGLQQSAQSLIAIGIDAEKVIPIMTTLGNVTSGMGTGAEGIKRATVAIQQMNAAGRITAEDLNQLRDAGVPVFDLLTAATGKTTAEIAHMAQNGKLGKQELEQLMAALETGKGFERFAGMMDKQSQSLAGLWATLKDTFSVGMAEAIGPAIPLLKQGLAGAIKAVSDVVPALQDGISWMLTEVPAAFQAVSGAASDTVGWLKDNAAWLVPLTAGITGYAAAVGTLTVIEKVRKMVVAWQAAQWGLNAAVAFFAGVSGIGLVVAGIAALVAGLIWAYHNVGWFRDGVQAAWEGIQHAVGVVVDWWQTYVQPTITTVLGAIGAGAVWLYENAIKPAFDFIAGAVRVVAGIFTWLWVNIAQPIFGFLSQAAKTWWDLTSGIFRLAVAFIQKILAPAFSWFWTNIISPVFTWIGDKIGKFWTAARIIFDALIGFIARTLGPRIKWLQTHVFDPVFGFIGRIVGDTWRTKVKPIFDVLTEWAKKRIPDAFDSMVGFVRDAWRNLQEVVKAPIRFVIEKVINEGIIGTFNKVADFLDVDGIDPVPVPNWLRARNDMYMRPDGRATGGIIPGYEPMKRDTVLMGMRAGEGVLVPEVVRALGAGFVDTLNAAGNTGGVPAVRNVASNLGIGAPAGRSSSRIVHPMAGSYVISSGYGPRPDVGWHDGLDFAAPTGTGVRAPAAANVIFGGWGSGGAGNMVHLDHGGGLTSLYYHLSRVLARSGERVTAGEMIGAVGSTGNSTGPHLHFTVRQNGQHINPAQLLGGAVSVKGPGPGSTFVNPFGAMANFARDQFAKLFPSGGAFVDLAVGMGSKLIKSIGAFVGDKIGIGGVYDDGGYLQPGLNFNGLGAPEPVLTPYQWDIAKDAIDQASGGGGDVFNLFGVPMDNAENVAREINFQKKRLDRGGKYAGVR